MTRINVPAIQIPFWTFDIAQVVMGAGFTNFFLSGEIFKFKSLAVAKASPEFTQKAPVLIQSARSQLKH